MLSTSFRDPFFRDPLLQMTSDIMDPFSTSFGADTSGWNTGGWNRGRRLSANLRLMNMDAFETDNEFRVIVECPGVQKDKIDMSVENGLLTVRVVKTNPDYPVDYTMVRNELLYGSDSRTIRIPSGYHSEPSCCQYRDGCLCMAFPRSEQREGKKLQIQNA